MTGFVKARVRALGEMSLQAHPGSVLRLDLNESPFDFPASLKDRVWRRVRDRPWSRYPSPDARELRQELATHLGRPPGAILVGNGSSELLQAIFAVALDPGSVLLLPRPTFELYARMGTLFTDRIVHAELDEDLAYDEARFVAAVEDARPSVVVLGSPNNPTGSSPGARLVERLLARRELLVVVDEAYHEFADGVELAPMLHGNPNLVLLRTFSKAWCLAGLRVGYLLGSPELVAEIAKGVPPFSVDVVAESCALVALQARRRMASRAAAVRALRDDLGAALARLPGVRAYPSDGSFILFAVPRASEVHAALAARGVLVRDLSTRPRLEGCLRVTAGTSRENARFLRALREVLELPAAPVRRGSAPARRRAPRATPRAARASPRPR